MCGFGVPLDFRDLSHLVLSSREEWSAVQAVVRYLHQFGTDNPVFTLEDESPTLVMGRKIASSSARMLDVWEEEVHDAECRVEGHWEEVMRKQQLAATLRSYISKLKDSSAPKQSELSSKQIQLAEHQRKQMRSRRGGATTCDISAYDCNAHNSCNQSVNKLSRQLNDLKSQISSKENSLKSALKAPPPVYQPLPKEKRNALPIIFFLYTKNIPGSWTP